MGNWKIVGGILLGTFLGGADPLPPLPVVAVQCSYQHLHCRKLKEYPKSVIEKFLKRNLEKCQKGEWEGCLVGGVVGKFGGEIGEEKGEKIFQKGCQLGNGESCYWLGEELKAQKKYKRAVSSFEKGCQLGSGLSCNRAGWAYWLGEGNGTVPRNLEKGANYFFRGCQLGNGDSCNNLGVMVEEGEVKMGDKIGPVDLYNLGCRLGSGQGCTSFGYWAEGGEEGRPRNMLEAYYFYRKGCQLENGSGCERAGELQLRGVNSPSYPELAKYFFEKGCQLGDGGSCSQLGELYAAGKGVRKDLKKAYFYLQKGCEMGDFEWGCNRALEIKDQLEKR